MSLNRIFIIFAASFLLLNINVYATDTTQSFFTMPDMVVAKISPDGESVATIRYREQQQQITLIDAKTHNETLLLKLSGNYKEHTSVSHLVWLDEQHVAAQLVEIKKGIEDLADTKSSRRLVIIKIPTKQNKIKIYSVRTNGWLVDPLASESGVFLYAKSSLYSKVYKIKISKLALDGKKLNKLSKIDGGQFKSSNEIKSISGFATRWFLDGDKKPKAVLHLNQEGTLLLSAFEKDAVSVIKSWKDGKEKQAESSEKKLLPIAYSASTNSFYCLDFNEEEKRTVYLVNYKTKEEKVVYEADSYKIIDIELSPTTDILTSVKVINNGAVETIFIGDEKKLHLNPNILVTEVNKSLLGEHGIIYRESHNNAGQFFIRSNQSEVLVGEKYPALNNKIDSRLIESKVNVEGLEIPYLLSMPARKQKPYPLIVMPHGGPIGVYDNRYYDPIVQYLVTQGYAVLRVNFRGSSGYNATLKNAGVDQWADLMLEDIYQATLEVIDRDDIDGSKVCSFGMSYGGYAATMLTIRHHRLYKCAASWAGVMDLNLYVNNPRLISTQKKWVSENVGVINWEYGKLKINSPIYLLGKLANPLFIGHGRMDEVVDIEHAFRMKLMLEKFAKNYQWYIDESGTHSFGSSNQMRIYFEKLNTFIMQNIH